MATAAQCTLFPPVPAGKPDRQLGAHSPHLSLRTEQAQSEGRRSSSRPGPALWGSSACQVSRRPPLSQTATRRGQQLSLLSFLWGGWRGVETTGPGSEAFKEELGTLVQ